MTMTETSRVTHGGRYSYRRCKEGPDGGACRACRDAHNVTAKAGNLVRRERLLADPTLRPHGNAYTYSNWMCRCGPCCDAANERRRKYVHSRVRPYRAKPRIEPIGREWLDQ